jgi:hypothetical protein
MPEPCSQAEKITKLDHAIFGNGEPGMKVNVALIKQKVDLMPTPNQLKAYAVFGSGLGVVVGYLLKGLFGV